MPDHELADPSTIPAARIAPLAGLDRNELDSRNLFRALVHRLDGSGPHDVPDYIELPSEMTGVEARILLAIGNRFPMIRPTRCWPPTRASFRCSSPDGRPDSPRAVWPSWQLRPRGIAISRIMDCRGVAVLPEGMSKARFDCSNSGPSTTNDIIRTPGTESTSRTTTPATNWSRIPRSRSSTSSPSSQLSRPLRVTGPALSVSSNTPSGRSDARLVSSSRRPAQPARSAPATISRTTTAAASLRSKRSNARRCWRTASAITTSKASATNTCR